MNHMAYQTPRGWCYMGRSVSWHWQRRAEELGRGRRSRSSVLSDEVAADSIAHQGPSM